MANTTEVMQQLVEAWNQHDPEKIASFFTEDCTYENEVAGVVGRGREVVRQFAENALKVNPDFKVGVTNLIVSGNMAATEGVMSGAHSGQRKYCTIAEFQGDLLKRATFYVTK